MQITAKILERGGELVTRLMQNYRPEIDKAYRENGEEKMKVGLSLTIEPSINGFRLAAGISFVSARIKDTFTDTIDEAQVNLFPDPGDAGGTGRTIVCPQRPDFEPYIDYCRDDCGKCDAWHKEVKAE